MYAIYRSLEYSNLERFELNFARFRLYISFADHKIYIVKSIYCIFERDNCEKFKLHHQHACRIFFNEIDE